MAHMEHWNINKMMFLIPVLSRLDEYNTRVQYDAVFNPSYKTQLAKINDLQQIIDKNPKRGYQYGLNVTKLCARKNILGYQCERAKKIAATYVINRLTDCGVDLDAQEVYFATLQHIPDYMAKYETYSTLSDLAKTALPIVRMMQEKIH